MKLENFRTFIVILLIAALLSIFIFCVIKGPHFKEENAKYIRNGFNEVISDYEKRTTGIIVWHYVGGTNGDGKKTSSWEIFRETKDVNLIKEIFDILKSSECSSDQPVVLTQGYTTLQLALYDIDGEKINILLVPYGDIQYKNKTIYYQTSYDKLREVIDEF